MEKNNSSRKFKRNLGKLLPEFKLDGNLLKIQTDFFLDENRTIITYYLKNFRSCLMCTVFGHMDYQLNEKDQDEKLTEILTYCIRCKKETIEKVSLVEKLSELTN